MAGADAIQRAKETAKPYRCSECSINFARPSHLARHAISHRPEAERSFGCSHCDKSFARHDVLLRHLRGVHQVRQTKKASGQRSCLHCVRKKLKCDRRQPCESCTHSKSACEYKLPVLVDDGASAEGDLPQAANPEPASFSQISQSTLQGQNFQTPTYPSQNETTTSVQHKSIPYSESSSVGLAPTNGFGGTGQPSDGPFSMHLDKGADPTMADAAFGQSFLNMNTLALGYGGLDWLDFHLQEPMLDPTPVEYKYSMSNGLGQPSGALPGFAAPILPHRPLPTEPPAMALDAPTSKPEFSRPSIQSWPFAQSKDHFSEQTPSRYKLPPLEEVLRGSSKLPHERSKTPIEILIEILSKPRIPDTWNQDLEILPGIQLLQEIIERYFADFHDILAILHIPTFSLTDCPTVLLASMACIGAMHLPRTDSHEYATTLCDLCSRMILWLGGSDTSNYSSLTYLMSCCLYQIYSLGSGNRQLYQDADRNRGVLIGSLRAMGLLKSQISLDADHAQFKLSPHTGPSEVTAEWLRWRDQEQEKRVTWASFEYDCSLSTLTGCRGAVDLAELPRALPCTEDLWRASNEAAWKSLALSLAPSSFGLSVAGTLELIMAGGKLPSNGLTSWGKRLCCQIIGRLLWDLKQLEVVSLIQVFRHPSLSVVQEEAKTGLLQGFSNLSRQIATPANAVEIIDYNIARLIMHYCNLFSIDNVMELILYIVRHVPTTQHPSEHRTMTAAKHQLNVKFANNPCKARKLVWHAAQIHAVANEYVVSAPCEILRVFMGSILLLAFSKYCPDLSAFDEASARDRPMVFLDRLDPTDNQEGRIDKWIQEGGPASLGGVSNIYSAELGVTVCQRTQGLLGKAQCWGLSSKFVKILQLFQDAEV